MEACKGFGNWLACLKCPNICTKMCPIEKENAMEELRQRISSVASRTDLLEGSVEQTGVFLRAE